MRVGVELCVPLPQMDDIDRAQMARPVVGAGRVGSVAFGTCPSTDLACAAIGAGEEVDLEVGEDEGGAEGSEKGGESEAHGEGRRLGSRDVCKCLVWRSTFFFRGYMYSDNVVKGE